MDVAGMFLKLPWLPFIMILQYLSLNEKKKMRSLSIGFEQKVTLAIFSTWNIKTIKKQNWDDLSETLSDALDKPYGPEIKLNLKFEQKLPKKDMLLMKYTQNIISLDIFVTGKETILLEPTLKFDCLRNLTIRKIQNECCSEEKYSSIVEVMLTKHAEKLEALQVEGHIVKLKAPALPTLTDLTLIWVPSEIAYSLFLAGKNTITSLKLINTDFHMLNNVSDTCSIEALCLIPKLRSLAVTFISSLNFMQFNSKNLVALNLGECVILFPNNKSYEWPELPNLKELIIPNDTLLPILFKCKDTLKSLEYHGRKSLDDLHDVIIMPKLTELYLDGPHVLSQEFLVRNKQNLEILILSNVECNLSFDQSLMMEKMKTVVLLTNPGADIIKYTNQLGSRFSALCSQAQVIFVAKHPKRKKGVTLKTKQQILSLCRTHKLCVSKVFTIYTDKLYH